MRPRVLIAVVVAVFVIAGGAQAQYGGVGTPAAQAQDSKPALEKGVMTRKLVTSLGGFSGKTNLAIELSGQVVEVEPGGQTGRHRFLVPAYIYVLEGTLTSDSEGGPVGIKGVQYHAAGQSYMDAVGVWHNYMNNGSTPLKYLLLFVAAPGAPTMQKATAEE